MFLDTGALCEARRASEKALVLARDLKHSFAEGVSLLHLGHLLITVGNSALGLIALNRSRYLCLQLGYFQTEEVVSALLAEHSLWLDDPARASALAEHAWARATAQKHERDMVHAALLQGIVLSSFRDFNRSDERLHQALTRARSVNMVQLEIPALIAIADLEFKRGRLPDAKARLEDVWEAAARGPYPRFTADAFNLLSAIAVAERDRAVAIEAANDAYKSRVVQRTALCLSLGPREGEGAFGGARSGRIPFCHSSTRLKSIRCQRSRSTRRTNTGSIRTSSTPYNQVSQVDILAPDVAGRRSTEHT